LDVHISNATRGRELTIFYLVRHAHADWTLDENRPLSAQGFEDAQRVADVLQEYPIRAIYSSPERRAYQTISPFTDQTGIQIEIEADLQERKLGVDAFEDFLGAVEVTWRNPLFANPCGESITDAQRRGLAVVKRWQVKHPNEAVVLSTHGNLMALILQGFDPKIDFLFWKSLSMPDIYRLEFQRFGTNLTSRLWLSNIEN